MSRNVAGSLSLLFVCGFAALSALAAPHAAVPATARAEPSSRLLGVELDPPTEGSRTRAWIDLGRGFRPWSAPGGSGTVAMDAHGWPLADAQTVFFDIRPVPAWSPPVDDPDAFQPDWGGTYHLSLHGQATISPAGGSPVTVAAQRYDPPSNTTTAEIVAPSGTGIMVLAFTHTRRDAASSVGSGFTGLHLIRPGYPAATREVFTPEFLEALRPFHVLRFMDWLSTNSDPGYYGDLGHHALHWEDRHTPDDATQQDSGGRRGVAWEYAIALANRTGKDIWINIPISATDDYIKHLALLLHSTLKPGLKIYLEHSNEVWNFGFPQYIYNKLAAISEVKAGDSALNNDGATDPEVWAHRRHAKRLVEISRLFAEVYGPGAVGGTIRPVYASWTIFPDAYYAEVLAWVAKTYGPPKHYFYAVADAAYFNAQKASPTASVPEILAAMRADSDHNRTYRARIGQIARNYGLKHCQYEVGPDVGGGSTTNVANRIRANRAAGMEEVILHDARDNWFADGGDLYMYFSLCSPASRYGCWGLSEDIRDVRTPKWRAIYRLTGTTPPRRTQ